MVSERSIAEIIGWEWRGQRDYASEGPLDHRCWYGPETGRGMWAPPGVEVMDLACWPNVDDMLGWLTTQDRFCALSAVKGMQVMVEVVAGDTTRFHSVVRGDTLTAALEAAVRKVDAEALLD